jgi:hypothetical protein
LAMADHPAHTATLTTVHAEIQSRHKLILTSLVITEFLHVVTDERRFSPLLA